MTEGTYQLNVHACGNKTAEFYSNTVFMNGESYLDFRLNNAEYVGVVFLALDFIMLITFIVLLIYIRVKKTEKKMHSLLFVYLTSLILTIISLAFNITYYFVQKSEPSPDVIYILYAIFRGLKLGFLAYIFILTSLGWFTKFPTDDRGILIAYFVISAVIAISIELISIRTEYQLWPKWGDYILFATYWIAVFTAAVLIIRQIIRQHAAQNQESLHVEKGSFQAIRRGLYVAMFTAFCLIQFVFMVLDSEDFQYIASVSTLHAVDFIFGLYPLCDFAWFYLHKNEDEKKSDINIDTSIDTIESASDDDDDDTTGKI